MEIINEEFYEANLEIGDAFDPKLLTSSYAKHFGASDEIQFKGVRVRVGRRPYAINLTQYFMKDGYKNGEEYKIFAEYDFCLLFQTVSVLDSEGINHVSTLGCKLRFDDGLPVTVLEVMPRTEFIEVATGKLQSKIRLTGDGVAGIALPKIAAAVVPGVKASVGADLEMSTEANFAFNLSFDVLTPKVIGVGSGDNSSEWIFYRQDRPLTGTHQLVQLLLVRKLTRSLTYKMNIYSTVKRFGFPTKFANNDWCEIEAIVPEIA